MGLTGIQIFKLLPKTNCGECGVPTCLAFAMALAAGKAELDKCPYVSEAAREQLSASSAPPVRPLTVGAGDYAVKVGGETVMFLVTTMGPTVHEFMVGPADAVATDAPGSAEIADIGMMRTKSLTYIFDGSGPYAFACHVDGHYEAGMRGTITLVE